MTKRDYTYKSICGRCKREIEQRVPTSPDAVEKGVWIQCAGCGKANFCYADRTEAAPEVLG